MSKTYTKQQILDAYDAAPQAVRDALTDGPAVDFLMALRTSYGMRIDIAGIVAGMVRNVILGLLSPTEFAQELGSFGIDTATAQRLISDMNAQVFVPLQAQMRAAPVPAQPPVQQAAKAPGQEWIEVSTRQPSAPQAPVPAYTPPPQRPSVSVLQQPPATPASTLPMTSPPHEVMTASTMPAQPRPAFSQTPIQEHAPMVPDTARPALTPVPQTPPPSAARPQMPDAQPAYQMPQATMRTMPEDMRAMHDGQHPEPRPYVPHNLPGQMEDAYAVPPPPVQRPVPPPPPVIPPQRPAAPPQTSTYTRPYMPSPAAQQNPSIPAIKKSGIDPYREPL